MVAALLRERAGYVASGKDDRVKEVDEQLQKHGYKSEESSPEARKTPPQERTAERPRETTARPEVKPQP
jgi:hypothetical protein